MIRRLALVACGLVLLAGCSNPALGLHIGGEKGTITVSPTVSGSLGNVSVSVGG